MMDRVYQWHTDLITKTQAGGLIPSWREELTATLAKTIPLVLERRIRAFFLGGEVCSHKGVKWSNVSSVAQLIRTQLERAKADALILITEGTRFMYDKHWRGYVDDIIPAAIDAIALDAYCPFHRCGRSNACAPCLSAAPLP